MVALLKGKVPERKPDGRVGPPKGYPRDLELYADPSNWKYPVHTPWHARAARRYFDEMSNRRKYAEDERAYVDWKIDEALKKFGEIRHETPSQTPSLLEEIRKLSLHQMLEFLLGKSRLPRAVEISKSGVALREVGLKRVKAKVGDYTVEVDSGRKAIIHDCADWQKRMQEKLFCKHVGALFLRLDDEDAQDLLRRILREQADWTYGTA